MIPASARSPSVPFHRNATDTPQGGGVQRDRVRHVARADHLHDERLASGLIEDVREAEREPERGDVPVLDPARRDERPEQEGLAGERRLRGDEQGALRQPVGHRAGDDGEHEDRRELQGGDEPEPERGVRELQHEPRLRDRLHPAPHQRQELGDVKAAEIAAIERAQRVGKRHPTPRREPWPSCAPILPSRVLPLRSRMRRATHAGISDHALLTAVYHAYNQYIAEFNRTEPGRYYGLGCLPNHDAKLAADELRHCATLGLHGAVFVPWGSAMPVWHEMWEPVWSAAEETGLVVSFHVFEGGGATVGYEVKGVRHPAVIGAWTTVAPMQMDEVCVSVILSGVCERHPRLRPALGGR